MSVPDSAAEDLLIDDEIAPRPALRILVVDDEIDICELLSTALDAVGGYTTQVATSAKAALRAIDAEPTPFDGVFLDIQMPGTTGIELCSIIRKTPGYADVPIIMLTAMTEQGYLKDAFAQGANDYIAKPFDIGAIRKRFAKERTRRHRRTFLKDGNGPETIRALEDAVTLFRIERCISKDAFETYILQSNRRYAPPLTVRAVKIARVYDLHSKLPATEFQKIVHAIGEIISKLTGKSGDVLTYFGNGVFFTATSGKSALSLSALSDALEKDKRFAVLSEHGLNLRVILGQETVLSTESNAEAILSLGRAIETAEADENTQFGWSSFREWLSHRRSVGQEQSRISKSAYEQILNEFIEEGDLGWK